jgi:hypothetical protein
MNFFKSYLQMKRKMLIIIDNLTNLNYLQKNHCIILCTKQLFKR